ncbi:hypothetical protein RRG08_039471 [Elysia crispata]|uniref:Uncharacterized protein n=1 Tax=Elysia crispata TaxID=231223 RepID=A0AAE1CZV5_9GAST|nr:hypothetical protein RRG08_039471 [Elysia crispata]
MPDGLELFLAPVYSDCERNKRNRNCLELQAKDRPARTLDTYIFAVVKIGHQLKRWTSASAPRGQSRDLLLGLVNDVPSLPHPSSLRPGHDGR